MLIGNGSTYIIPEVNSSNVGNYTCVAKNILGSDMLYTSIRPIGKINTFYLETTDCIFCDFLSWFSLTHCIDKSRTIATVRIYFSLLGVPSFWGLLYFKIFLKCSNSPFILSALF